MSVPANQFDQLLARLAKTKPLPPAPSYRTTENVAGARLADSVSSAFRNTPSLEDAIREIASGNRASRGPTSALGYVGKAAMLPLNVIDMPRRAVISTLKEAKDALDGDTRTKASFGDWGKQFSDPSFGFGRVVPGKGWGGRIVGFLGDVALDPLTYMTFGAAVPLKAAAKGGTAALGLLKAGRVLAPEIAEDVALRTLLGTKTVAGREGRFALANVVRKYGGSAEEVANVAARGKSAVPEDIARAIGLQRSGLYMFGSRVRLPGSGLLGDALERGLVGARLGLMNTKLGTKLSYLYTPRGSGATGDLSTWRADLASKRLNTNTVKMIFSALNGAEEARALGSRQYAEELARVTQMFDNNPEMAALRSELHKYIEKPESAVLSGGPSGSVRMIEDHLMQAGERIKLMMNEIEPGWQMPLLNRYVPHVLTRKAREEIERNIDQPWAQYLQRYLSVDVNDLKNNVTSRYIKEGMEDFLGSGETVVDGSIDGINQLFRKVTKNNYDLFETDMQLILAGYARTVAQARELTTVMRSLKDADFVRVLRETGHVDPTYMTALKQMVDDSMGELEKANAKLAGLRDKMSEVLGKTVGGNKPGGTVARLLAEEREALGAVKTLDQQIADKQAAYERLAPLLEEAQRAQEAAAVAVRQLTELTSENSAVVTLLREQTVSMNDTLKAISAGMQFTSTRLRAVNAAEELLKPELLRVEDELAELSRKVESTSSFINFLKVAGDFLGPEIERVFASFRDEMLDSSARLTRGSVGTVDVAGVAGKQTNQQMNKVLQAVSNPMDTDFLVAPKGRADAPDVINDAWVRSVVDSEGTPERALLDSIPDFGAVGSKAERVSMGSTRQTARSMNLIEARDAVVRAAVTGDNHQEAADAFVFLTLRELRAAGLNAGEDAAAQKAAQAAFAQELLDNQTTRAKAWNTALAALKQVETAQREFTEIVSRKNQLGTVTVGSQQMNIDTALEKVKELSAELVELNASGIGNATVRASHQEFMGLLDDAIAAGGTSGRGGFMASSQETQKLLGAFFKFMDQAEIAYGRILPDTETVDGFVKSFIQPDDSIDADSLIQLRAYVEGVTKKHLIDKDEIARVQRQLDEYQNSDVLKEASRLSQRANASEFTSAQSLRAAGDVLVNYSIFHNARVAIDYVHRLLPASVEVSDSLLKYAFAGSARQHAVKIEQAVGAARWVQRHMRQIAAESEGVLPAERALWLLERVGHKILPDGSRVPLSETEVGWMQQVIGDLYNFATTETIARDLPNFRASKQTWRDLVKQVLDTTRPGWDDLESSSTLKTEQTFIRTPKKAKLVTGRGDEIQYVRGAADDVEEVSREALAADAAGKYSERSVASNRMNIYRMTVEDLREEIKKIPLADGGVERKAALLKQLDELESSIKSEWKNYSLELKKKTGRSPSQAAEYQRSARQNKDAHGIGAYWLEAVRMRSNGSTLSPRQLREFFVRLLGDGEITVDTGLGRGFALDEALNLQRVDTAGQAIFAQNVTEIWRQARAARRTKIEQMVWIAANNGMDQDSKIVRILNEVNDIDEQLRIARLPKDRKQWPRELIDDLSERQSLLVKEFTDSLTFKLTVDAGGIPYDISSARALGVQKQRIGFGDSHLGKTIGMLEAKLAPLREMVFNPDAGLNNLASLRFGFDELGGAQLGTYRISYLRGLAEDYRIALLALEEQRKELKKALPLKKSGEQVNADFDLFREVYAEDPQKFAKVSRWIEAVQDAVQNNTEIPARPTDVVIPQKLANAVADMRRAAGKLNEVVQRVEFGEAVEARRFDDFLKVLSQLDISAEHLPEAQKLVVAYNDELYGALSRRATALDPTGTAPTVYVRQSTVVPFEAGQTMDAIGSMDDGYDVVVRLANGTQELVDKPVAANAVKQTKKGKFEYRISEEENIAVFGQRVYVFEEIDGTRFTFPVNPETTELVKSLGLKRGIFLSPGTGTLDAPVYSLMTRLGVESTDGATQRAARQHQAFFTSEVTVLRHSGEVLSPAAGRTVPVADTRVFFNLSGQQRVLVSTFDEMGVRPSTSAYTNPGQIFADLEITNERIAAAFARETDFDSKTTTSQFNKVNKLREEKRKLEAGYRSLKSRKSQQEALTRIEEIDSEMASILGVIEAGTVRARAGGLAIVRGLYDYFQQPHVASAILGRIVDEEEAKEIVVKVFERYVKMLHDVQATRTLADGSTEVFNPFVREVSEATRLRDNVSANWKKGPYKKVLDEYNELNSVVNAATRTLTVAKDGGEANHLLQKYVSVLRQLRAAEKKADVVGKQVEDALFVNPESLISGQEARAKIPQAQETLAKAVEAEGAAKRRLDAAKRIIVDRKQLEDTERSLFEVQRILRSGPGLPAEEAQELARVLRGRGEREAASRIVTEEMVAEARRSRAPLAQQLERLRGQADEAERLKNNEIQRATQALEDARAQVVDARQNVRTLRSASVQPGTRRESVAIRRGVDEKGEPIVETYADMSKMTPDAFDDFIEQEIKAIKDGVRTSVSISISQEQLAAKQAQLVGDQARLAELEMVAPELRARVQSTAAAKKQLEQRMENLLDQFNKVSAKLRRIETATRENKNVPFGGRGGLEEYAALQAQQKDIQKRTSAAWKQLQELQKQADKNAVEVLAARSAGAEVETLKLQRAEAEARLNALSGVLASLGGKKGRPAWVASINARDWDAEFDSVQEEVATIVAALKSLPPDVVRGDADKLASAWTKYVEGRAAMLLSRDEWNRALTLERMGAAGILDSDNMIWTKILDDGFEAISGSGSGAGFQNLQMRPEVGEFLSGMGRIRDKGFVLEMRRWMGPYTKFFKAWALATPGFHVRNSITNAFMMIAAGGNLRYLNEGMREYNALQKFLKTGLFSEYLETISDPGRRRLIEDSYNAMHGSGVGQFEEIALSQEGRVINNFVTRTSRKAGTWVEQHSRFMLAYDGIRQGYGVQGATARVRRFLFDYEDLSALDVRMRQIIPFWIWTSRNFPLTIQNVILNPRPYQIYNNMKRNLQDEKKTSLLPQYMREAGGFALPGGAAVTPELGFNRMQADIAMFSDPTRFAANVNPLLRVPLETQLADRMFFRDREFEQAPVPTSGPVGNLAALLGQPLGLSQSVGNQRYVNDKFLYALTNMLPLVNTAERFIPSQEYYQQRGNLNPLLGFLGSPVREVTPQMRASEMNRRYAELQKLLQSQPQPVEE